MRWGVLAALLGAAGPAAACPLAPADGTGIDGDGVQAAWAVSAPIEAGRHFTLQVRVCPPETELLQVDAMMPVHRHGMNYRPSLTRLGPGRWRVEGLMFHMSGAWELRMDLRRAGRTQTLRQSIDLP